MNELEQHYISEIDKADMKKTCDNLMSVISKKPSIKAIERNKKALLLLRKARRR
ncbi:hypothetical protein [Clostridium estertheticum]|uniref:hypothetical protein n=1 Tax=Clostridium estertheticum TaxID=238834 RepID=UPI001CF408AB|nr:hypothetical protein [Clostridium estertheticum]MCB2354357.1 hypothetical protein [Clostridium estertheticum]WAG42524.1 hypothetical protein LL065_07580 [Clostridium estertheticum]